MRHLLSNLSAALIPLVALVAVLAALDYSGAVHALQFERATGKTYAALCADGFGGCDMAAAITRWGLR